MLSDSFTLLFGTTPSSEHLSRYTCAPAAGRLAGLRTPRQTAIMLLLASKSVKCSVLSRFARRRKRSTYCHLQAQHPPLYRPPLQHLA